MPTRTREVSYDLSVRDTGAPTVRQPRAEDSSLPLPLGVLCREREWTG